MTTYFGLDIGSSSIKAVMVNGGSVVAIGIADNPLSRVGVDLLPAERQKLVDVVKKLLNDMALKTKKVVISIPEVSVFAKVMAFPVVSTAELSSAIKWQADQDVPLPIDEIELSWVVIDKPVKRSGGEQMKVLVVATPKKVSKSIVEFAADLGLEPIRAENEIVSLARLFLPSLPKKGSSLIVDFGANALKMVAVTDGLISLIHSYSVGGLALSRSLAQEFSLGLTQAEQYKRAYGVDPTQVEGRVYKGLEPVMNNILDEFAKAVAGFDQANPDQVIERVIAVGGCVFLKNFVKLLSAKLGMEVLVGNPFAGYKIDSARASLAPIYAVAMGLAIEEKA